VIEVDYVYITLVLINHNMQLNINSLTPDFPNKQNMIWPQTILPCIQSIPQKQNYQNTYYQCL